MPGAVTEHPSPESLEIPSATLGNSSPLGLLTHPPPFPSLPAVKLRHPLDQEMKEEYVTIKKTELQLILAQIDEMKKKLAELKKKK